MTRECGIQQNYLGFSFLSLFETRSPTHYVAKKDSEFSSPLVYTSRMLGLQACDITPGFGFGPGLNSLPKSGLQPVSHLCLCGCVCVCEWQTLPGSFYFHTPRPTGDTVSPSERALCVEPSKGKAPFDPAAFRQVCQIWNHLEMIPCLGQGHQKEPSPEFLTMVHSVWLLSVYRGVLVSHTSGLLPASLYF